MTHSNARATRHAREGGHPVSIVICCRTDAPVFTGSSAFADDDRTAAVGVMRSIKSEDT
jgi:hypothetical protein